MDGTEFDAPGTCPACGMALIEKSATDVPRPKVAIFVFDGVQVIDFAAPYEVFGGAGYDVFTVGVDTSPVRTNMNLTIVPRYGFADSPVPDVLLVPGGSISSALSQISVLDWIRARSREARQTISVCNGAFFLAHAEMLDGLTATTFYGAIEQLRNMHPKITVVSDRRFVDNGTIITTAGLSSGIDGALHVVAKLSGRGAAQMVALNMEYDWKEDDKYARAAFADVHIRRIFGPRLNLALPSGLTQTVESTQGGVDAWETNWQVSAGDANNDMSAAALADLIGATIAERSDWAPDSGRSEPVARAWQFHGENLGLWQARLNVTPIDANALRATLAIQSAP
jgi:putative intracellular protease/amidase